jgi:hypothetical protein
MRIWLRRSVGLLAIYVIALTAILSVFAPAMPAGATATAVDPFSVICHSGSTTQSDDGSGPAAPASLPAKACDHCTLCNAAPAPAATFDGVVVAYLAPAKVLHAFVAYDSARHDDAGARPWQARGPPQLT